MNVLDTTRHSELFKPEEFQHPIHVIGAGATGSWLVLQLVKLGLTNITVWDFDVVEEHNIANQAYNLQQVGQNKVDALQTLVRESVGVEIQIKRQKYENQRLSGFVFLMVDSMAERKRIWEESIKLKPQVVHLVEPRMGLDLGRIYNVNPVNLKHIEEYEQTYYSDEEAEVSACGTSMTVITSAMQIASICVRQLINFHNQIEMDNEIVIDMKYNNLLTYRFEEENKTTHVAPEPKESVSVDRHIYEELMNQFPNVETVRLSDPIRPQINFRNHLERMRLSEIYDGIYGDIEDNKKE